MRSHAIWSNWTCSKCMRRLQKRANSTVATATTTASAQDDYPNSFVVRSSKLQTDDNLLRRVFNDQHFWRDFSKAKASSGLVGNSHLTNPRGFHKFAETTLAKCRSLVDRTLAASTPEEFKRIPRDLDRLSDLLCRVIDLSDFIRTIHPEEDVVKAASASYSRMFQYMNELNTTTGLNKQLKKAWNMPEIQSLWTREEKMVAVILIKDFAKSGVDLPEAQREEFVNLSNDIANIGTEFVNSMDHANDHVLVKKSQLTGVDPRIVQNMSSWGSTQVPINTHIARIISSSAPDPDVKKSIYIASHTASRDTIKRLEHLLLRRAKLAKLTGHDNFGEMTLADKMAKQPDAVTKFLQSLHLNNKGAVSAELAKLLEIKKLQVPHATKVDVWEHQYLVAKLRNRPSPARTSRSRVSDVAKDYFAVGHVIQGLSSLFESLYGVRLVPKETQLGETWHPDVRRLDVYTDRDEHIATMYCDLYSRRDKLPNPAHFTLLCSREISAEEVREAESSGEPLNLGMPTYTSVDAASGTATHHQIPIIALVCDFPDTSRSLEPSTLSLTALTTLFHEMGHAIHSILGRTTMQGISGTRCATDFAELPSVLMEYFATNPAVLKLFARHWRTDETIPDELISAIEAEQKYLAGLTGGWDNEVQILMAMLDQIYHADGPVRGLKMGSYDSTKAYHDIWNQYGSLEEPASTAWQGFFGHLYGYGATYYSYLFDRAIARQVWRAVFNNGEGHGAVDREAGERFKNEVLRWGGGRDPWLCLEGLMGDGKGVLAEGGAEAMDLVGQWGVGAASEGHI